LDTTDFYSSTDEEMTKKGYEGLDTYVSAVQQAYTEAKQNKIEKESNTTGGSNNEEICVCAEMCSIFLVLFTCSECLWVFKWHAFEYRRDPIATTLY